MFVPDNSKSEPIPILDIQCEHFLATGKLDDDSHQHLVWLYGYISRAQGKRVMDPDEFLLMCLELEIFCTADPEPTLGDFANIFQKQRQP